MNSIPQSKIQVVIFGSGNIGTDLALRMMNDERFEVCAVVGRRIDSPGLVLLASKGLNTFTNGIEEFLESGTNFDLAFDATSALEHEKHWAAIRKLGKPMIDLTPSKVGESMVPILIGKHSRFDIGKDPKLSANYSMVTCGGQSSAGILFALTKASRKITSVEISSSIASKSAGLATRRNIDNYISATEDLAFKISNTQSTKAILVLNPAEPPVMMRTTVTVSADSLDIDSANEVLATVEKEMQSFVPGYRVIVPVHSEVADVYSATALVEGAGFYLPSYAGNLDVINAAAVQTAWLHMQLNWESGKF